MPSDESDDDQGKPVPKGSLPNATPPVLKFEAVAAGSREIVIEYLGQQYRLRVTRNGGLILNK